MQERSCPFNEDDALFVSGFCLSNMTTTTASLAYITMNPFLTQSISTLQTVVTAIGGGLSAWGVINLLEGYGNDNPGAKSQGIKQLMARLLED